MTADDIERIARTVLRELGVAVTEITVSPESVPDRWRVRVGDQHQTSFTIRCGRGTTAQFVRSQIFDQYQRR